MSAEIQSVRIFIAYSSKDLEFQRELKNHLEPLVRNKRIVVMDNYAINPGDNWDEKIGQMLEQADIVLLLLSADALASPHFFREAGIAIERRRQGRTDIIPVKLRPCDLEDEPLLQELDLLEVLPEKDVPVVKWPHRDEAYVSIVQGLKRVLRGREEAVIARKQRTQRQKEYAGLIDQAEALLKKKKWVEANALLDKALKMWEERFEPKRDLLEKHSGKCIEKIKEAEDAKLKKEQDADEAADNAEWQIAEPSDTLSLDEIVDFVAYDETKKALEGLRNHLSSLRGRNAKYSEFYNEVLLLMSRFNRLDRKFQHGMVPSQEDNVERAKINYDLVALINIIRESGGQLGATTAQNKLDVFAKKRTVPEKASLGDKIRQLVALDDAEAAIYLLEVATEGTDLQDEATHLDGRYRMLKRRVDADLLSPREREIHRNNILDAILTLAKEL